MTITLSKRKKDLELCIKYLSTKKAKRARSDCPAFDENDDGRNAQLSGKWADPKRESAWEQDRPSSHTL